MSGKRYYDYVAIFTFFCQKSINFVVTRRKIEGVGTVAQKVVVQQLGDFHQQAHVNTLALQHLVGVRTVAMDGVGKPGHRTPLSFQLGAYHVSYMNLGHLYRFYYAIGVMLFLLRQRYIKH